MLKMKWYNNYQKNQPLTDYLQGITSKEIVAVVNNYLIIKKQKKNVKSFVKYKNKTKKLTRCSIIRMTLKTQVLSNYA